MNDRAQRTDGTDHERAAATFAATLTPEALPDRVRDHVGLVLADTVGAILGGSTDDATRNLSERLSTETDGPSTALGTGRRLAVPTAALVNGTAGTVLELDEGHKYAAGHPSIHVVPAVLADAEARDAGTGTFLAAFVAGYEVATQVARACNPLEDGYHPHGVWGAVGAAAGVARLRGYDPETTLDAMRIAANDAQHTRMEAAVEGATVRNTYAGKANLDGVLAAEMAAAGFTGLDRGIERHLDPVARDGFDAEHLDADLGERWEVTGGYFKRHAACRYTHPTLDAIAELQDEEPIDPDDVETVLVETYPTAAGLTPTRPANSLQAKFSIPFAVATRLVHGHSDKEAFAPGALTEETSDLAERVRVEAADDITSRLPDARSARVTVRLNDGRELSREVEHARGGTERPWSEPELAEKFETLVAPILGDDAAESLWRGIGNFELTPGELCAACRVDR